MAKNQLATVTVKDEVIRTFSTALESMRADDIDSDAITLDIMQSADIDSILGGTAVGLKDMIGIPFTIHKAVLHKSDYENSSLPAYVAMYAELDDGERIVITSGANSVVAQCIAMHTQGFLPYRVSSKEASKPTSAGYYPISLCKADEQMKAF